MLEGLRYQKIKEKIFKLLDKLDKFTIPEIYERFSDEISFSSARNYVFEYYELHKDTIDYYIDRNKKGWPYVFVKVKKRRW